MTAGCKTGLRHGPRPDTADGVAAVEFAILLPLFLLVLLGTIEFSLMLYDKAMLTNASREGARAGIVYYDPDLAEPVNVEAVVNNYLQNYLISLGAGGASATVTDSELVIAGDRHIRVRVTYTYRFLVFPNIAGFFGGGALGPIQLTAETVMRMEDQNET